jgi:hypothetical protein
MIILPPCPSYPLKRVCRAAGSSGQQRAPVWPSSAQRGVQAGRVEEQIKPGTRVRDHHVGRAQRVGTQPHEPKHGDAQSCLLAA